MKKHNIRKDAELLVEHILEKDPISANSVFQRLIMEAEEEREDEVFDELGLDDTESVDAAETDEIATEPAESEDGSIEGLETDEADAVIDDIVEINCQINAKMISNLFDKIAELKNSVEGLQLDENSREYLKYDVTIQYYSDKLQDLQNKTNPGIDQSKVEAALEKISTAIEELSGEVGGSNVETDSFDDIETPAEIEAENDLGEDNADETEAETDGEESADDGEADTEEGDETAEDETEEISDEDEVEELFG